MKNIPVRSGIWFNGIQAAVEETRTPDMKSITYEGKRFEVEIVSLSLPREPGLMGRAHPAQAQSANVALLCYKELPLGAKFMLDNADDEHFEVKVLGCSARPDGRHVIVGLVLS